jgi:hypothetical protein
VEKGRAAYRQHVRRTNQCVRDFQNRQSEKLVYCYSSGGSGIAAGTPGKESMMMNQGTWLLIKDMNDSQHLVTKSTDQGFWRVTNDGPGVVKVNTEYSLAAGSTIDVFKDANAGVQVQLVTDKGSGVARGTYEFLWTAPTRLSQQSQ